jgi:hypothetical protein
MCAFFCVQKKAESAGTEINETALLLRKSDLFHSKVTTFSARASAQGKVNTLEKRMCFCVVFTLIQIFTRGGILLRTCSQQCAEQKIMLNSEA